ncbi:MAG TPA: acyltransferase [Bryobacteraceae bacterium]|nr:acyltransferase [Bryobacteraceae bacterium]
MFPFSAHSVLAAFTRIRHRRDYRRFLSDCKLRNSDLSKATINLRNYAHLRVGSDVVVNDAFLDTNGPIEIENFVFFGWQVKVLTGSHDYAKLDRERQFAIISRPVRIRQGAWICSYAILLPGCEIGEHSVVSAGSVVRGIVRPFSIVAGNPARQVGDVKPQLPGPNHDTSDLLPR